MGVKLWPCCVCQPFARNCAAVPLAALWCAEFQQEKQAGVQHQCNGLERRSPIRPLSNSLTKAMGEGAQVNAAAKQKDEQMLAPVPGPNPSIISEIRKHRASKGPVLSSKESYLEF